MNSLHAGFDPRDVRAMDHIRGCLTQLEKGAKERPRDVLVSPVGDGEPAGPLPDRMGNVAGYVQPRWDVQVPLCSAIMIRIRFCECR